MDVCHINKKKFKSAISTLQFNEKKGEYGDYEWLYLERVKSNMGGEDIWTFLFFIYSKSKNQIKKKYIHSFYNDDTKSRLELMIKRIIDGKHLI